MRTRRGKFGSSLLVAWLAALAVLAQTLVPAIAMARPTAAGQAIVICTVDGPKLLKPGEKPTPIKSFGGFRCGQCVAASLAAVTPDPAPSVAPIVYAARIEAAVIPILGSRGPARIAPRPPGQGPPLFLNA
ncbi:MAG: DUF2946 family protein [Alphaproteobacteria bacterium]|nr:DUF2946 family protein [Alphaproteobacteria bacterium]